MNEQDYSQAVAALFARTANGIKPGLEVILELLAALGNPHQRLAVIHVAGTNGKGSVCAMIESVLRASGFKTGLYTSPHLIDFSERFRVDGADISEACLGAYIERIEQVSGEIERESGGRAATFFEMSTAIAFQYFADEEVDFAIIETGMGGRWDATNVVIPLVSVMTHIDMDHTDFLGETLVAIAGEKAGIIKPGRPVVSAPQAAEVLAVLRAEGEPIVVSSEAVSVALSSCCDGGGQRVKIETQNQAVSGVVLPLSGPHQRENCGIAVAAVEVLADMLEFEPAFKVGLESVFWGGRFQVLRRAPLIIYDGAHNPSAARALAQTLKEQFRDWQVGFIFGFLGDKDVAGFLKEIKPVVTTAWAVSVRSARGLDAEAAAALVRSSGASVTAGTVPVVLSEAIQWAGEGRRLICITGSLYLKKEVYAYVS